ncbi:MAG: DUF4160 domain-containing protein [Chloroflexi bacterium]|nr:DUF4160 domain-containing protein [Chloroflexota bacterium]
MPTVLRSGPYSFRFYASDGVEPPHVHVHRENMRAKFWLDPVKLEKSKRFSDRELNRIKRLIIANQVYLLERWDEFFLL